MEGLAFFFFFFLFRFILLSCHFFCFFFHGTDDWFLVLYFLASGMPDLPFFALRPLLDLCLYWSSLLLDSARGYLDPHV